MPSKNPVDQHFRVQQSFNKLVDVVTQEARDAVTDAGKRVLEASKEFVPVDTGALKASGRVTPTATAAPGGKTNIGVFVTFGGKSFTGRNTPTGIVTYAAAVHEKRVPFLLLGLQEVEKEISSDIKARFKVVTRKGSGGKSRAARGG